VHYWADLQSVHGFRCCDNIAPNAKCQLVLVLALCLDVRVTTEDVYCELDRRWTPDLTTESEISAGKVLDLENLRLFATTRSAVLAVADLFYTVLPETRT